MTRVLALGMSPSESVRRTAVVLVTLSFVVACGGTTETGNVSGAGADASRADSSPDSSRPACALTPPTMHRASAVVCSSNALDASAAQDAAPLDGSAVASDAGTECITDQDCGATGVCSCIGNTFGYAHSSFSNVCVPSNCRVDADCGQDLMCSPSFDLGAFYGIRGYYCHTRKDECNDTTCACGPGYVCAWAPQVAHWACAQGGGAG